MSTNSPRIDAHTHIFCWGENPRDGYLSQRTRKAMITKLVLKLTGVLKESGENISEKMRNRYLRQIRASKLDFAVALAQDAVYREDGSRDDGSTHFYVSNDYVLDLAKRCPKVLPGCSINPIRKDALQELERCHAAGARLVKVHTAIQGVDPSREEFDPFYELAKDLNVVLMFHTGYEHSCTVVSQKFTDPRKLERPLGHGGTIIAAHCGTCAFFDAEDYYPNFIEMMTRFPNLYGDTAIMTNLMRWRSMKRLSRADASIRSRIVHGSDYPFPPGRLPFVLRTGLFPAERHNPFDMDLRIKESFDLGPDYSTVMLQLLDGHSAVDEDIDQPLPESSVPRAVCVARAS